jgi:hypothetical protein
MEDELRSQLLQEYRTCHALYTDFSQAIKNLLEQLLAEGRIKFQQSSSCEKNEAKLAEKIDRKKAECRVFNYRI